MQDAWVVFQPPYEPPVLPKREVSARNKTGEKADLSCIPSSQIIFLLLPLNCLHITMYYFSTY